MIFLSNSSKTKISSPHKQAQAVCVFGWNILTLSISPNFFLVATTEVPLYNRYAGETRLRSDCCVLDNDTRRAAATRQGF